jgi:hypothetical protein
VALPAVDPKQPASVLETMVAVSGSSGPGMVADVLVLHP